MKKVLALALCLAMLGLFAGCSDEESTVSSQAASSTAPVSSAEVSSAPTASATIGDYAVSIEGARKITNKDGAATIVIKYSFTNFGETPVLFTNALTATVSQNESTLAVTELPNDPRFNASLLTTEATTNVPQILEQAYVLANGDDVVKVTVTDAAGTGIAFKEFAIK